MTKEEAAACLNENEYTKEGSKKLWAKMKAAGLVAVFGASDDLMEFRGAEDDEFGAYDGGEAPFTRKGLLRNECENEDCPHHAKAAEKASKVKAVWDPGDGFSWRIETEIPHAQFTIVEDGQPFCRGLVFALADVPA